MSNEIDINRSRKEIESAIDKIIAKGLPQELSIKKDDLQNKKSRYDSWINFIETINDYWDKVRNYYYEIIPYHWRPKNFWYSKIKCPLFKKYTTIKPRKLDHGWCDRDHLLIHVVFEVACNFIEKEGPETPEEWKWQKQHNPRFYKSWKETKELCDWWLNEYDEDYPYNLSSEKIRDLEKEKGKLSYHISEDYKKDVRKKCKRLIDLSPWYWT